MGNVTVLSIATLAAPVFVKLALQALGERSRPTVAERSPTATRRRVRTWHKPKLLAKPSIDRVLVAALVCHGLLILGATLYFSSALALPVVDALYFVTSTVTTVGYGDISLRDAPALAKLFDMFLMFAGAGFVAVLFALFTGWASTGVWTFYRAAYPFVVKAMS